MLALSRPSIFKHCVWHLILKKGNTAFKNLLNKFNIKRSKINAIFKTCKIKAPKLIPLIIYDIISGGPGLDETLHTVITGENFTIIVTYRKLNTM